MCLSVYVWVCASECEFVDILESSAPKIVKDKKRRDTKPSKRGK